MQSLVLTELGISVFEDNKCLQKFPFSDPVKEYLEIKKGDGNLGELLGYLSNLESMIQTNDVALMNILKKSIDVQMLSEQEIEDIHSSKPEILVTSGFAKDQNDAMAKLRDFAISLSSSKIAEVSESPDLHIAQGINTLDEVDKIINGISSRLREWYGLHFPELDNLIDSIVGYSQIVIAGKRKDLNKKIFEDAGFPESKVEMLSLVGQKSRGGDISKENLLIVQDLAKQILELHDLRKNLEEHIETQMNEIAPNLSVILGASVGARILAHAGSLKKLSSMPASTIQILGAEKALFRSLKTGSAPPKHGILFQHALVHAAPRWQRGKIARAIAAKAAIAARVDVYGDGINKTLLEKLNVRVKEIGEKYKVPPEKKPRPEDSFQRERWGPSRDRDQSRRRGPSRDRDQSRRRGPSRTSDRGPSRTSDRGPSRTSDRGPSRRVRSSENNSRSKKVKGKKRKKFGRR